MAKKPGASGSNQDLSNDLINEAANMDSQSGNPGSESQTETTANDGDPAPGNMEIPNTANLDSTDPAAQNIAAGNIAEGTIQDPAPGNLQPLNQPDPGADLPRPNTTIPLPGPQAGSNLPAPNDINQSEGSQEAPLYAGDAKDADAATLHAEREKRYGPDYVVATRGDNQQTVFTALAWNQMRGDKGGWTEQVQVPSEIRELRKSKK